MRFLLDTHAFLWWLIDDPKLPENIRDLLADPANEIYVTQAIIEDMALITIDSQIETLGVLTRW